MRPMLIVLLAALPLAACGGEEAMRTVAATSAGLVNEHRTRLESYVAAQNDAFAAWDARLEELAAAEEIEASIAEARVRGWQAVRNEAALRLHAAMTATGPDDILARAPPLRTLAPAAAAAPIKADVAAFDATVKALAALAKEPDIGDRVRFLQRYGKDVADAYKDAMKKAETAAKESEAKARTADSLVTEAIAGDKTVTSTGAAK